MCRIYLNKLKDLRLRLEGCENRTVTRLHQLADKEPLKACAQKTTEQMVKIPNGDMIDVLVMTLSTILIPAGRKSKPSWKASRKN